MEPLGILALIMLASIAYGKYNKMYCKCGSREGGHPCFCKKGKMKKKADSLKNAAVQARKDSYNKKG